MGIKQLAVLGALLMVNLCASQDLFEVVRVTEGTGLRPDASADGVRVLLPSGPTQVLLENLVSGVTLGSFSGFVASFSPSGNRLAVFAGDQHADVYDVVTQVRVRLFDFSPWLLVDGRLSTDGEKLFVMLSRTVTGTQEHWVFAYDCSTGGEVWSRMVGTNGQSLHIAISPDGSKLATGMTNNNSVYVLDPETGVPLFVPIFQPTFRSLSFTGSSDGLLIGTDNLLFRYNATTGAFQGTLPHTLVTASKASINTPHAATYSSTSDPYVYYFWNTDDWSKIGEFKSFSNLAGAPDFSQDGRYFVYTVGPPWNGQGYVVRNPAFTGRAAPDALQIIRGTAVSGSAQSLQQSDANRLVLRPGVVLSTMQPPIQFEVECTAPQMNYHRLRLLIESQGSASIIQQTVELYNFTLQKYFVCDVRQQFGERPISVSAPGPGSDYVDPMTGKSRARLSYRALGPVLGWPWQVQLDYLSWRIDPE